MNWIRQNSFLAAFFAVTIAGTIALGVLLYMQYDNYSTTAEEYNKQADELKHLQSLAPYPSEENLKKLRAQRQALDANIQTLRESLAKMALPIPPTSPEQFQDRLRASVLAAVDQAKQNEVKLPEKFYLGFDGYQTTPPKPSATMALANQMAGIELVLKTLIENKVAEINSVKRAVLVEEDQTGGDKPSVASPAQGPINKTSFEVAFKAEQNQARKIINAIADSKKQFFVLRGLRINNEKLKAPSKKDGDDAKSVAGLPEAGKPAGADAPSGLKYIIGTEKIDVVAQIEIVNFKGSTGK